MSRCTDLFAEVTNVTKVTEYGHILYQLDTSLHRFNYEDQFRKTMYK